MERTVKRIFRPLTLPLNLNFLIRVTDMRNIFPFYHAINDHVPDHLRHVQQVRDIRSFETDLDFLMEYFEPVSLKQYLDRDVPGQKKVMVLTFDDGLRECHDIIAPILRRRGIPAVFFLNNNFIDNKELFYRYKASILIERYCNNDEVPEQIFEIVGVEKRLIRNAMLKINYDERSLLDNIAASMGFSFEEYMAGHPVYMSGDQVRSLIADGFEIGSHSFDHPRFNRLPAGDIKENIIKSINELSDRFNLKQRYFSFPFSSDGISTDLITDLLDDGIVDVLMGTSGLKTFAHKGFIQRIPMEKRGWSARTLLKTEYLYYLLKAPFRKNRYTGG